MEKGYYQYSSRKLRHEKKNLTKGGSHVDREGNARGGEKPFLPTRKK